MSSMSSHLSQKIYPSPCCRGQFLSKKRKIIWIARSIRASTYTCSSPGRATSTTRKRARCRASCYRTCMRAVIYYTFGSTLNTSVDQSQSEFETDWKPKMGLRDWFLSFDCGLWCLMGMRMGAICVSVGVIALLRFARAQKVDPRFTGVSERWFPFPLFICLFILFI